MALFVQFLQLHSLWSQAAMPETTLNVVVEIEQIVDKQ